MINKEEAMKLHKIRQVQVDAAEAEIVAGLPALLGISRDEFERRMNAPYKWPTVGGVRCPQGDCSWCREIDERHPEGRACDFSCVGV